MPWFLGNAEMLGVGAILGPKTELVHRIDVDSAENIEIRIEYGSKKAPKRVGLRLDLETARRLAEDILVLAASEEDVTGAIEPSPGALHFNSDYQPASLLRKAHHRPAGEVVSADDLALYLMCEECDSDAESWWNNPVCEEHAPAEAISIEELSGEVLSKAFEDQADRRSRRRLLIAIGAIQESL